MKSSYKLLGLIWDGKPDAGSVHEYDEDTRNIYPYDIPRNLFDIGSIIRKIPISTVFCIEKVDELELLLSKLTEIDLLIIEVDFMPTGNKTLEAFMRKRLMQVYSMFLKAAKDVCVSYCKKA